MATPRRRTAGANEPPAAASWITTSVRFPAKLWEKLERDAKRHRRSKAQHLLWIIEEYLSKLDGSDSAD